VVAVLVSIITAIVVTNGIGNGDQQRLHQANISLTFSLTC